MFILRKLKNRVFLIALLILVWWWLRRPQPEGARTTSSPEIIIPPTADDRQPTTGDKKPIAQAAAVAPKKAAAPTMQPPDDLVLINGIGPKLSSLLNAAGITTFAELANTPLEKLCDILGENRLRLAHPETWAKQARLAAAGDWQAFEALQIQLKSRQKE